MQQSNKTKHNQTNPHFKIDQTPSTMNVIGNPTTVEELINIYGTYNIQPTANTGNAFPAIAQGRATGPLKKQVNTYLTQNGFYNTYHCDEKLFPQ